MTEHRLTAKNLEKYREYLFMEEHSKRTIEKYCHDVQEFYKPLPKGKLVSKERVLSWKEKLRKSGYAVATINSMLVAVNGLCRFLGWTECCVKLLRQQRRIFRDKLLELTRKEYLRLLQAAKKKGRYRLMLVMETLCATGIRISELRYVTVEAAREGRAVVSCKNKSRVIILPAKLCKKLLQYCDQRNIRSGTIFLSRGGNPLDRSNIWSEMKKLCGEAAVDPRKVYPHNFRHLFARAFYSAGHDLAKLADILGHSSIETTRIYIMESGAEHERLVSALGFIV